MPENHNWTNVKLPENAQLLKKETFEYTVHDQTFLIELFLQPDGMCYAIGVPKSDDRLIIYGSSVVESEQMALQIVIDKIERETGNLDYFSNC